MMPCRKVFQMIKDYENTANSTNVEERRAEAAAREKHNAKRDQSYKMDMRMDGVVSDK